MKLSHPREHVHVSAEDVARLAGLCDLRVGKHFLRNEQKAPVGCVWVRSFWRAEVLPSFHPSAVLAVVSARGEPFNDCISPDWVKAVFATQQEAAVILIEADPLPASLGCLNLLAEGEHDSLDGIGYTFTFETPQFRGALQFGNPVEPGLRSLESGLLTLARKIAAQSGSPVLQQVVDVWKEFVEDKRRR